jgi:ABC-type antimicrobial peptide transport system permease subunit
MKPDQRQFIVSKPRRLRSVIEPYLLASIAMKNLMNKRLRTFLTLLGIIIGVGAIVFLVSLALGLHGVVNQQVIGTKSVNAIDVTTPNSNTILLNNTNANKIANFANVKSVSDAYILAGIISYQGARSSTVVYGVNNQYIALSGLKFVAGKSKLAQGTDDAIVNTSLLALIGQNNSQKAIGRNLSVSSNVLMADGSQKVITSNLVIVGVINTGSGALLYMNSRPFANAGAAQYGEIIVEADKRSDVATIRSQIEGLGLTTASPLDTLSQINTIFTIFTFVVIGFGGIGMVIAVLGMFNTLTISLLERTKEIGLMITMGARKADVQRLLVFEAILLSLIGGVLGIIVAGLIGVVINLGLTHYASNKGVVGTIHAFNVTPLLIISTLFMILVIGLLVAYYPSRRSARINPIDALRHE